MPRIPLKRVIHVKDDDDDEELIENPAQIIFSMAQATDLMITEENARPRILLKRIRVDH